jgi:hypothetical protein
MQPLFAAGKRTSHPHPGPLYWLWPPLSPKGLLSDRATSGNTAVSPKSAVYKKVTCWSIAGRIILASWFLIARLSKVLDLKDKDADSGGNGR